MEPHFHTHNPDMAAKRPTDRRYWIILFGILAVALRYVATAQPDYTERWYGRGCFGIGRTVWDYTLGWSPVPLIYVLLSFFALIMLSRFIRGLMGYKRMHRPIHWLLNMLLDISASLSIFISLFLVQWGYNYCRPAFETQTQLQVDTLSLAQIRSEAIWISQKCAEARAHIPHVNDNALNTSYNSDFVRLESDIRTTLTGVIQGFGYPVSGRVRVRLLYPKGILLRSNTAGVYLPWVAEGHIDAGLHPLQMPFTLAHEMAHGYGFTDEGVCNFLAYLACERSTDMRIRYSGRLAYWRYVFSAMRKKSTSAYLWERAKIPKGMFKDLVAIKETMAQYPDFLNGLQASIYDNYLHTQGVKEGMASYERILYMVVAYKKQEALGQ